MEADPTNAALALIRHRVPGTIAIYLFGSAASGERRPDSDMDLAVLGASPIEPVDRFNLQEELASLLHTSVDLVDLRRSSTVMTAQVVTHGSLLFESDPVARATFEAVALASYARLNEERKDLLADIARRGTIHHG